MSETKREGAIDLWDDPAYIRDLARHWQDEAGKRIRPRTHWAGCEREHADCALWVIARHVILRDQ